MIDMREVFPRDAMEAVANGDGVSEWRDLWVAFWWVQQKLATIQGTYYSELDRHQEPKWRACGICNQVNDTNEFGELPHKCENAVCQEQRAFWGYTDEIRRPGRYVNNCAKGKSEAIALARARSSWFGNHMRSTYGTASLFDLPEDARLSCLMSMTLERMAIEQRGERDKRIAASTIRRNDPATGPSNLDGTSARHRNPCATTEPLDSCVS